MTQQLTERYNQALVYAAEAHATQYRKGHNETPYLSHLLGVSSLVIEAGGDEDEAIAALLHDTAEDQGGEPRLADIAMHFGERVAGIVRECSDSLAIDPDKKEDWSIRKQRYVDHLTTASPSAVLVSAADKTHNARALVSDIQLYGLEYLRPFSANAGQTLWYYREVLRQLQARNASPRLLTALSESVEQLGELLTTAVSQDR